MMPFYKSLNAWALTHSQTYERIVSDNEKLYGPLQLNAFWQKFNHLSIRDLTEQRELEHWDFTNTKAFMLMKRSLNRSLQLMVAKGNVGVSATYIADFRQISTITWNSFSRRWTTLLSDAQIDGPKASTPKRAPRSLPTTVACFQSPRICLFHHCQSSASCPSWRRCR